MKPCSMGYHRPELCTLALSTSENATQLQNLMVKARRLCSQVRFRFSPTFVLSEAKLITKHKLGRERQKRVRNKVRYCTRWESTRGIHFFMFGLIIGKRESEQATSRTIRFFIKNSATRGFLRTCEPTHFPVHYHPSAKRT
jgi:hypothetical protein